MEGGPVSAPMIGGHELVAAQGGGGVGTIGPQPVRAQRGQNLGSCPGGRPPGVLNTGGFIPPLETLMLGAGPRAVPAAMEGMDAIARRAASAINLVAFISFPVG